MAITVANIESGEWAEGYKAGMRDAVVHAHWEQYADGWYCANCELYAPFYCDPEEKGILYCPNCGAKMDEEDNEDN